MTREIHGQLALEIHAVDLAGGIAPAARTQDHEVVTVDGQLERADDAGGDDLGAGRGAAGRRKQNEDERQGGRDGGGEADRP
jgi:hypothetical protein